MTSYMFNAIWSCVDRLMYSVVVFFKQKTAYEMRISDWSSDVCSSDLLTADPRDAVLSLKQISLDFPAGTTEAKASELAANFAQATRTIAGCGGADAVAQQLGASVVSREHIDMQIGRAS